jgi:hypothetical protein
MSTGDVEITFSGGWIEVVHTDCEAVLERYELGINLDTIVDDVESSNHVCD